jgi:hypothetical protein
VSEQDTSLQDEEIQSDPGMSETTSEPQEGDSDGTDTGGGDSDGMDTGGGSDSDGTDSDSDGSDS